MLPIELPDPEVRPAVERRAMWGPTSGTPFVSFFIPTETLALGREADFRDVQYLSAPALAQRYLAGRRLALVRSTTRKSY
jgi:hypothetical protein